MKKIIMAIFAGILVLFPRTSKADIDVLSSIQDSIASGMEKVNKVVKDYTGFQFQLQELSVNRDMLGQLKQQTIGALQARAASLKSSLQGKISEFINTKMDSFSLPGIKEQINMGDYAPPALKTAIAAKYVKKAHTSNDLAVTAELDLRNNNLRIENAATLYANAIVNRRQLTAKLKEDVTGAANQNLLNPNDDKGSQDQLPKLTERYSKISRDANHRWVNILSSMSRYHGLLSESSITQKPVDNLTDVIGSEPVDDGSGPADPFSMAGSNSRGISIGDVVSTFNKVKSGDYTGALGNVVGGYANLGGNAGTINTLNAVVAGASAATNVYNGISTGNWGGALAAAGGGVGSALGGQTGGMISSIAGSAGSAVNAGVSGNWGGVIASAGSGVGMGIGGQTGGIIGSVAGSAGSAVNASVSGNWGGAVAGVATGAGTAVGGNAGNIINSVAGSAGSAVNAAVSGNTQGVVSSVSSGVGSGLSQGGLQSEGALVNSAGTTVSQGIGLANQGGNIVDIGTRAANDSGLKDSAEQTYDAYRNLNNKPTDGEGDKK